MSPTADEDQPANIAAFLQALKHLDWVEDRNLRFDIQSYFVVLLSGEP